MTHPTFSMTAGVLAKLFVRKVTGIKNIPWDKPFIVAANHVSYLDPWIISAIFVANTM